MFTKAEILSDLDSLQAYKALPFFRLETQAFVVCRVHLYSDSTRWAIVLEELKPSPGGGDITLYFFGNCLINQERHGLYEQYQSNTSFVRLINEKEFKRIVVGKYHSLISKKIKQVQVRDRYVPVEHDLKLYKNKGIPIIDYLNPKKHVDYIAVLRYLNDDHPELLRATDQELKRLLPKNLPKLMELDSWHFKDFSLHPTINENINMEYGHKPSSYETFHLIADVLVSRDQNKWKPTLSSNNHWRNNIGDN